MFLLDTNVLSELRRPDRAHPRVIEWAADHPVGGCFLSAVTILELELGVMLAERKDPAAGRVLRAWLEGTVLTQFDERILPVDVHVARRCAALHVPDPRSQRDALIAATALVHGMAVVTRNVADFIPTGVVTIDPWV